jgi:hypothetical protein
MNRDCMVVVFLEQQIKPCCCTTTLSFEDVKELPGISPVLIENHVTSHVSTELISVDDVVTMRRTPRLLR